MKIAFSKYHGTGNDFVIIDNRNSLLMFDCNIVSFLCDRHRGIGADGLILLHSISDYDFEMVYYNSDGNQSTMCGNGGRSIVAFAHSLGLIKDSANFYAIDGSHYAEIVKVKENETIVRLNMQDLLNIENDKESYILNTGSPHYVTFVNDVENSDIISEARKIRYNDKFKHEGINIDFIQIMNNNTEPQTPNPKPETQNPEPETIFVRTYERGVENETLSCGTGVVASAIAYALKSNIDISQVNVKTLGGNLTVRFQKTHHHFTAISLEGPATFVFHGEIDF
jgi:diaminopimelate epimerase